jgi:hypothetical protein
MENGVPNCIFFFRDGVSEGEYLTVTKDEKDQMQGTSSYLLLLSVDRLFGLAAIDELWASAGETKPKPSITFLIVTKR